MVQCFSRLRGISPRAGILVCPRVFTALISTNGRSKALIKDTFAIPFFGLAYALRHACLKTCFSLLAILVLAVGPPMSAAKPPVEPLKLTLVSDQYCPYTCAPHSENEGYFVDLVRVMLEPEGFEIEYRVAPWIRALRSAQSGLVDGLLAVSKGKAKKLLLSPVLGVDSLGFMTRNMLFEQPLTAETLHQLDNLKVAQVGLKTFNMERAFDRYLSTRMAHADGSIVAVSGKNTTPQLVKMLLAGRVDVVAENPQVLAYTVKVLGQQAAVNIQGNIEVRNLYIGFKDNDAGRRAVQAMTRELPLWRAS